LRAGLGGEGGRGPGAGGTAQGEVQQRLERPGRSPASRRRLEGSLLWRPQLWMA
jgi:hypothetical protein